MVNRHMSVRPSSTLSVSPGARVVSVLAATLLLSIAVIQSAEATAGAQEWVSRLAGPGYSPDGDAKITVSPDGSRVFVAATSDDPSGSKIRTVAYDASTGSQVWAAHFSGKGALDVAAAIGASPDGTTVFVVGTSGYLGSLDYVTLAYNSASGTRVWKRRFSSPLGISRDEAAALGVSPDGSAVFVTGAADGGPTESDYLTVAYDASTGQRRWTARHAGPYREDAQTLSVSPDGSAVFVSGYTVLTGTGLDILTVGYDAATGTELWKSRFDGPIRRDDQANAMGVGPNGATVYVTGFSDGFHGDRPHSDRDFITLAYATATGTQRWARRYNGPGDSNDNAKAMAVSSDGSGIFVTGYRGAHDGGRDFETIAYSPKGSRTWLRAYNGPADSDDQPTAIGVSPDGKQVFVTGFQRPLGLYRDYATLAYRAGSGAGLWSAVYDASPYEEPAALAVAPDGSRVYVTGLSGTDFTTVAYSAG